MSMTEEEVRSEWDSANIGRDITEDDIKNWTKFGHPGQLLYELGGGTISEEMEDGSVVTKNRNGTFAMKRRKDGVVINYYLTDDWDPAWITTGEKFAYEVSEASRSRLEGMSRIKIHAEKDGRVVFGRKSRNHGLLAGFDKAFGTSIEDDIMKIIPKEYLGIMDVIPGNQQMTALIYGKDGVERSVEGFGNLTGLDDEDAMAVQTGISDTVAAIGGGILGSFAGNPAAGAAAGTALNQVGRAGSYDAIGIEQDWEQVLKGAAVSAATTYIGGAYMPNMNIAGRMGTSMAMNAGAQYAMGEDDWEKILQSSLKSGASTGMGAQFGPGAGLATNVGFALEGGADSGQLTSMFVQTAVRAGADRSNPLKISPTYYKDTFRPQLEKNRANAVATESVNDLVKLDANESSLFDKQGFDLFKKKER